jgi:AraC family chitin signaling transcriptional activator
MKRLFKKVWRYIKRPFTIYKDLIQEKRELHTRLSNNSSKLASKEEYLERLTKQVAEIDHPEAKRIAKSIKRNINPEKYWEVYLSDFNIEHRGYIDRLKKKHPSITLNQLRLCVLIKNNMDNQKIADQLAIELDSVKKQKYRLKKKLKVSEDYTLNEYLNSI